MTTKPGAYLGGIRTLEDMRQRCRMDDCGCWVWSMGVGHGKPSVVLNIDGKHQSFPGRRAAVILSGKFPKLKKTDTAYQSDDCPNAMCVNPAHCAVGSHSAALKAAHRRNGWKNNQQLRASGHRIKAFMSKLDDEKAKAIRLSDETNAQLAARFGVSPSAVSLVRRGKTWIAPSVANSVFSLGANL